MRTFAILATTALAATAFLGIVTATTTSYCYYPIPTVTNGCSASCGLTSDDYDGGHVFCEIPCVPGEFIQVTASRTGDGFGVSDAMGCNILGWDGGDCVAWDDYGDTCTRTFGPIPTFTTGRFKCEAWAAAGTENGSGSGTAGCARVLSG